MLYENFNPKKIKDQIIVITNAESSIGIETALLANEYGATVVLGISQEQDGDSLRNDIFKKGGKGIVIPIDISDKKDLLSFKEEALKKFGRIDTWINNSTFSVFGNILGSDLNDEIKMFEQNFWSARIASEFAVDAMKENGGVLINLGLEIAVTTQPLLGVYSASKLALKAFTDALRIELKNKRIPVEVCLVYPAVMDAPFRESEKASLVQGPFSLSPIYFHNDAAKAILKCAEAPQRDVYVGGPARLSSIVDTFFPQIKDLLAENRMNESKQEGQLSSLNGYSTLRLIKLVRDNLKVIKELGEHKFLKKVK